MIVHVSSIADTYPTTSADGELPLSLLHSTSSLYHDERDVYENTLEITVSDLRVGDDTNGYFWSLPYLNICMKILFRS